MREKTGDSHMPVDRPNNWKSEDLKKGYISEICVLSQSPQFVTFFEIIFLNFRISIPPDKLIREDSS